MKNDFLSSVIQRLIKEELKFYDKVQFKNIKDQKPDKVDKDRMAVEDTGLEKAKKEFLENVNLFVIKYNSKRLDAYPDEDFIDDLVVLGKFLKAKRKDIETNVELYKRRPTITVNDIVELLIGHIDTEHKNDEEPKEPTKTELNKTDPERAKEVKDVELMAEISMKNIKSRAKKLGYKALDKLSKKYSYGLYDDEKPYIWQKDKKKDVKDLDVLHESHRIQCANCGDSIEHEEYEDNPRIRCSNCGACDWIE